MTTMPSRGHSGLHLGAARWLIVIVLSGIVTALVLAVATGVSPAWAEVSSGAADHLVVVAGRVTAESYGLYLVDLKNGTISVYQYIVSKHALRLMAVRNYTFDVQLDEYNTEPPPLEIKKLVQQNKRVTETK